MSFTELETQALGSIADGLAGSDPRLASMLTIFRRLAAGEEMPVREKTPVRRRRPAAHRRRRARAVPAPGHNPPASAPPVPAAGLAAGHAGAGAVISAALRAEMIGAAAKPALPVEPRLR